MKEREEGVYSGERGKDKIKLIGITVKHMEYYIRVLEKYAEFDGRATRSEFWYFVLFNFIVSVVLGIVNYVLFGQKNVLGLIYSLAVLIPSLAVSVRRLHDTGRSGWFVLVMYIPLLLIMVNTYVPGMFSLFAMFPISLIFLFGAIVLLVYYVGDSQPGANEYGPNPKESVPAHEASVPPVAPVI